MVQRRLRLPPQCCVLVPQTKLHVGLAECDVSFMRRLRLPHGFLLQCNPAHKPLLNAISGVRNNMSG